MKHYRGIIIIGAILIAISFALYELHYATFHDPHHIFIFMLGDLAFLPLEVLIVGIVVERILSNRELNEKLKKLNMVIGAFFSEVGNRLMAVLSEATTQKDYLLTHININQNWTDKDYKKARILIESMNVNKFEKINLQQLKSLLIDKRSFMLALIENPNLLEHEKFTDLLLSVFHLTEELESRPSFTDLPESDTAHIQIDISRVYKNLIMQWLDYMHYLKSNYPFLYSHYLRTHPFQENPSAIVK